MLTTIAGCKSQPIAQTKLVLPPTPQRQYIETPVTTRDYAYCILYYEQLVQEWELWGAAVEILTAPEQSTDVLNDLIKRNGGTTPGQSD